MKFLNILFVVAIFTTAKIHAEGRNELQFNFGAQHFAGKSFYPHIIKREIPEDYVLRYIRRLNDDWGIGGEYSYNIVDNRVRYSDLPINLTPDLGKHSALNLYISLIGARYFKLNKFRFGVMALAGLNCLSSNAPSTNYFKSSTSQETIEVDFSEDGTDLFSMNLGLLLNAMFFPSPHFGVGIEAGYLQNIGRYDLKVSMTNCFRPEIVYPDLILRRRNPGFIPIRVVLSFRF